MVYDCLGWISDSLAVKDNVVPCSDAAGVVVEVGLGVRKWTRGDRVMPSFTRRWFLKITHAQSHLGSLTADWTHGPLNANLKASSVSVLRPARRIVPF